MPTGDSIPWSDASPALTCGQGATGRGGSELGDTVNVANRSDCIPGLAQLRNYERVWLRGDLVAGVTVAAYLVPQVMAYASLAGLPAVVGLWAVLAPLAIYALLGSSRQLSVGPESTTALMTAAVVAPLALGDPARYALFAAALAVLVGGVCLAGGIARLGFLADLLSRPVLVGYMTGIALLMIASQAGKITGTTISGDEFIALTRSFVAERATVHWPTAVTAAAVLMVLWLLGRWVPRAPGPLIAVLLAAAAVATWSLDASGIAVVGEIPTGLPVPTVPTVSLHDAATLIVPALGIAVVAFSDNVLTARAFATRQGQVIDANAELRALGVCNIAAGLTHGFPVSSSGSRTALGDAVGSRTQVYSLTALFSALGLVLFARDVLAVIPMAALGALVVYAATRLIDVREFRRLARFRLSELMLALATTVAVLGLGVLYGILVAVALSVLDLLRRVARAHDSVQGIVPGVAGMHDVDDYPQARQVPGLIVYRYDAPLCFANAHDFLTRALAAVEQPGPPVEWFVLNAEANVEVDMTAIDALDQLRVDLGRRGIVFAMARVKQDLRDALAAAGLLEDIGTTRVFMTLPTAVEAFRHRHDAESR